MNVRVLTIDGEPWFVATDVCNILELSNTTIALSNLRDDERSKFNLGRQGETNFINEAGLYRLMMRSRKPQAENKRHNVFFEYRRGCYLILIVACIVHESLNHLFTHGRYEFEHGMTTEHIRNFFEFIYSKGF